MHLLDGAVANETADQFESIRVINPVGSQIYELQAVSFHEKFANWLNIVIIKLSATQIERFQIMIFRQRNA